MFRAGVASIANGDLFVLSDRKSTQPRLLKDPQGGMEPVLHEEMRGRPITPGALFGAFLKVSLYGFGGPIVWARRVLIEERNWLSDLEFAEILSFCQFLPGPNVVSMTVCIGAKFQGAAGALAALAGFVLFPWTLGFAIGVVVLSYAQTALLQGILRGVAAAAAGMIIATGIRLLLPHRRRPVALAIAALAFTGLAAARLPLLIVVVGLVPVSIAMAGRESSTAK